MARWLMLGLAFLLLGVSGGQSAPALSGTLAYIHRGAVYVAPAAGGTARRVPGSLGASLVSLSPAGGTILFFVDTAKNGSRRGFVSRAPYTRSQPLPAPLDRPSLPNVVWSPEGARAYVSTAIPGTHQVPVRQPQLSFTPADGRVRKEPYPVDTASRDGKATAWADFASVRVREAGHQGETVVASDDQRRELLAALRSARRPERLKQLRAALMVEKSSAQAWAVSPPALAPDGEALYFACNAGAPMAAPGDTSYCFFVQDVAHRKLTALSGLGDFASLQLPEVCRISPDGKRLLFVNAAYESALRNTQMLHLVDLETQRPRELLSRGYTDNDSNLTKGPPCWSPDSRYVAADVCSYRIDYEMNRIRARKPEGGWGKPVDRDEWNPSDSDYSVLIFDAATGREVRRIPQANSPSWSR